jgi:cobalt-zinc-cadmium efflux system outer membrane protein
MGSIEAPAARRRGVPGRMTRALGTAACCLAFAGYPAGAALAAHEGAAPSGFGAAVEELLVWAEQHNPELSAMRYEVEAAEARIVPAGALEDPMFAVELRDMARRNGSILPGEVGNVKYTFSQAVPFWGKRDLREEAARAGVGSSQGQERTAVAEIRERIKTGFAQHYQVWRAVRLTREILELMADLERIARARYEAGLAPQQDVIKAQVEQTMLQTELIALETEASHIHARINSLLYRPAHAPLDEPRALRTLPSLAALAPEALEQRVRATNPQLFTQASQIAALEANQRLVERNRYPDFRLSVSPVAVDSRLEAWEAMVEVNIPLRIESRRAQEREARAMADAARARREATTARLLNDLHQSLAALETARRQEMLVSGSLLPQAELNYQSALVGYEAGRLDFATLLDAQRQIRRARLDALKARVEQEVRRAEIERMIGADL